MTKTTDSALIDDVLTYLANTDGAEAVSYLHKSLREDGWKRLGNLADFESLLRTLGFTVREGRNSRNQRRIEVTL